MENSKLKIPNPVKIRFDPKNIDWVGNDEFFEARLVERAFKDDIARTLWLAIKSNHMVNRYFGQYCIDIAIQIRKQGISKSVDRLRDIITKNFGSYYAEPDFVDELFPYINGQKELKYKIVKTSYDY